MLKINVIAVGGIKEKFFVEAIKEYSKRLSKYCQLKIIEVDEESNQKSIDVKKQKESERLIASSKGIMVLLDREGELVSSEKMAEMIDKYQTQGNSELTFVIGGSNGVSEQLKQKANKSISFGKITFPHQLFRVVLLEQIYRAVCINSNTPYHK
ncbi:MAG: 23S rRNA (pseudouridine(1915)-N(3))-methyltransferase RlmH [Clostridia bacterium]|nr:23S rRNA (pseudouridine(1915)-N(3))-methyltransferase RlmH [Clostridia bacterium]